MDLKQIDPYRWQVGPSGLMRVPGIVYSSAAMAGSLQQDEALKQVANVATLPGIVKASLAMPDMHWGYGFPIGGVAAFDWSNGVVSPGGVGYDVNCGVRLAATDLHLEEVHNRVRDLVDGLYRGVPCGVGSTGSLKLSQKELKAVLTQGSRWAVQKGFGQQSDIDHTEDGGCLPGADPGGKIPSLGHGTFEGELPSQTEFHRGGPGQAAGAVPAHGGFPTVGIEVDHSDIAL